MMIFLKPLLICVSLSILAACDSNSDTLTDTAKTLQPLSHPDDQFRLTDTDTASPVCPQDSPRCYDYAAKALASKYPQFIQYTGDVLNLQHYNGSRHQYKPERDAQDDPDYCAICSHLVVSEYPMIDSVLIYRGFYEGFDYLLVNLKTGQETQLAGLPIFSPDFRHMLSIQSDIEIGFNLNSLSLYSLDTDHNSTLSLDAVKTIPRFAEQNNIGFSQAKWLTSQRFIFQTDQFEQQDDQTLEVHRYFMAEQDPAWRIHEIDFSKYHELKYGN